MIGDPQLIVYQRRVHVTRSMQNANNLNAVLAFTIKDQVIPESSDWKDSQTNKSLVCRTVQSPDSWRTG